MDYGKAKIILKKLSMLIDSFESIGEPISEIESEMLHKYIEKLSQLIPDDNEELTTSKQMKQAQIERKRSFSISSETNSTQGESNLIEEQPIESSSELDVEEPVTPENKEGGNEETAQNIVEKEVIDEMITKVEEKKVAQVVLEKPKVRKTVLVSTEDDDSEGDTSDLWAPVEIKELSHKLSFSPIRNIFKAISINERILIQNELFDGDSKAFKETLDHLETFGSFQDAANYLKTGVAKEHRWEDGKKIKKANNFMKIVQRRFL